MVIVSAAQMDIHRTSLDENVKTMVAYMHEAPNGIICFPETSLTDLITPSYSEVQGYIQKIGETAKALKLWTIFGGYAERDGKIFNEVYVLDRNGALVYTYQKRHLWNEKDITPGDSNKTIETDFGKIGVITCWDIAFPAYIRELTAEGAKIIFCPSYWYDKPSMGKADYYGYPYTRAHENQVFFVMCDAHPNKTNNYETLGRSKILSPVVVLAEARSTELISADLNLSLLDSLRQKFDCWRK